LETKFEKDGSLLAVRANIAGGWHRFPSGRHGFYEAERLDLRGDWTITVRVKFEAYTPLERTILNVRRISVEYSLLSGNAHSRHEATRLADRGLAPEIAKAHNSGEGDDFPKDSEWTWRGAAYDVTLRQGTADIRVDLYQAAARIIGPSKKRGVFDKVKVGSWHEILYYFELWVIFTPPPGRRPGDLCEWDLLPFLPGGLPETNRRRF
jgi:hypothetical protein